MSETKRREYKRSTIDNKYFELCERIKALIDYPDEVLPGNPHEIKDLIIFGSYVNTDKEKIHDLDVNVTFRVKAGITESEAYRISADMCVRSSTIANYWTMTTFSREQICKYLANKSGIYSIHTCTEPEKLSGRKVYVVKDGKFIGDWMI